ncbi:hypothetical protein [Streptomyces sp. NPDC048611]|uniref:hypothetical protein n=1 Tax=Streptomyces sp. NPDC048611 TaxID=3155635 RepID=UPI003422559D
MDEQQVRALVDRLAARAARHRSAAKRCMHPEAAFVHDGWAAGLEEATVELVEALDGAQAARTFRERLTGGPGRTVEGVES